MRHHQAGRAAQAEALYAQVLAAEPTNLQALMLSGALAHAGGRNDQAVALFSRALAVNEQPDLHYNVGLALWASGRRADATRHWRRALALNPNFPQAHMNLGNALREEGALDEAVMHLRRALQLQPSPFAHNNLGLALSAQGRSEAASHYETAIAMHPEFIEPYLNGALDLARAGASADALALVRRSLQVRETAENRALFVRIVGALDRVADDAALRALVTRAAIAQWGPAGGLATVAATLLKHGSTIAALVASADRSAAGPEPFDAAAAIAVAANEPLLGWLLEAEVICDVALERFLTRLRAALLRRAADDPGAIQGEGLRLICSLAHQCFINEYVYATSAEERARATRLRDALAADLRNGAPASAGTVAAVACYFPLSVVVGDAERLLAGRDQASVAALVRQQISEPGAEARCRGSIPQLTTIEDGVSRQVQAQYEQNPYPRWIVAPEPRPSESLDALIRQGLPRAPFSPLGKGGGLEILIAGCGTGRQAIAVARQFPQAQLLAIDLSTASLGYAKVRTDALEIRNISYAQGDIQKIASIGRTFDLIHSDGVLHHLGDPWAGWRALLSCLRPGGVMHISLYSEIARRDVAAARAFIAERSYTGSAEDIRACRDELMRHADGTALKNVTLFNDFFTTSECRDLLFHVQEHRMTLPEIKAFLAASGLVFLGFELDLPTLQHYAARFPGDPAMIDLDQWDVFERDHPYTFASMYRFWVQKPA